MASCLTRDRLGILHITKAKTKAASQLGNPLITFRCHVGNKRKGFENCLLGTARPYHEYSNTAS